jgi:hypothetical protein
MWVPVKASAGEAQWMARPAKPLPALLTDQLGRADPIVELRLREDAIAVGAAFQPRGVRLLVDKRSRSMGRNWARPALRCGRRTSRDLVRLFQTYTKYRLPLDLHVDHA